MVYHIIGGEAKRVNHRSQFLLSVSPSIQLHRKTMRVYSLFCMSPIAISLLSCFFLLIALRSCSSTSFLIRWIRYFQTNVIFLCSCVFFFSVHGSCGGYVGMFLCVYCMDPESLSMPILGIEIQLCSCMCFAIWDARTGILETEEDPQPCLLGVCYFVSLVHLRIGWRP